MRKIIVSEWMSLDGVFEADKMDKWFFPYDSEDRKKYIQETILGCDAMLLGRTTYEMLAPYWSIKKKNEDGLADKLNSVPKYVVSSSLKKAEWNNSTIIKENVVKEIAKLKKQPGKEIRISGSATLAQSLMGADLIDEYRFLVHPIIMGSGKNFFKEGKHATGMELLDVKKLDKGVVAFHYKVAPLN